MDPGNLPHKQAGWIINMCYPLLCPKILLKITSKLLLRMFSPVTAEHCTIVLTMQEILKLK